MKSLTAAALTAAMCFCASVEAAKLTATPRAPAFMPASTSGYWYSTDVQNEAIVIETGTSHQFVYFLTHDMRGERDWHTAVEPPAIIAGKGGEAYQFSVYSTPPWGGPGGMQKRIMTLTFRPLRGDPESMDLDIRYEPDTAYCPAKVACVSSRRLYQLTRPAD